MKARNVVLCFLSTVAIAGCTAGVVPGATQTPAHDVGSGKMPMANPPLVQAVWSAKEREHVDLWLHSYALISQDTTLVPYFRRGYAERVEAIRKQRGVVSLLETNRVKLLARIAVQPSLATTPQFLPLYFPSWDIMRAAIDQFVRANGTASATTDQAMRGYFAVLAASFPVQGDRDWLRTFAESVDDESTKFYHAYWTAENRSHASVIGHVDSLWQRQWRPSLQRYLNNTQQQNGELLLTMPLGGEGRTIHFGKAENIVAGPMPQSASESEIVLYVMAHEVAGNVASQSLTDNTTPADQRSGRSARFEQAAAVRAGAMLLERTVPLAVSGYMRYYLQAAGKTSPTDPRAAFVATFAVPDAVRDAITRQLDVILGGI